MGTRTNFICIKCGKYEVPHRENRRECKECEGDYIRQWKKKTGKQKEYNKKISVKRRKIKEMCVQYLGGQCQYEPTCCTPVKEGLEPCIVSYHFHHRDPMTKTFDISRRLRNGGSIKAKSLSELRQSDPNLIEELDKCMLLCPNCHLRLEYCDGCFRKGLQKRADQKATAAGDA